MCIAFKHSDLFSILETAQQNKNWNKIWNKYHEIFLAVQNTSIGDLVIHSLTQWVSEWVRLTEGTFTFGIQRATLETCNFWHRVMGGPDQKRYTFIPKCLPIKLNFLPIYLH